MIYSIINIGLVDSILFDNGAKVVYTYAMNGEKLRVRHHAALTSVVRPLHAPVEGGIFPGTPVSFILYDEESYYGGDIVKKSSVGNRNVYTVPSYRYYFGGGYMEWEDIDAMVGAQVVMNPDFYYYTKDHLGNVRSVVTKNPSTNEIAEVQQTHYYPFGGIIADLSTGTSVQNKLYNGKELDTSNNLWWYDYGARQYDPTAPRFTSPDPLAEKYYPWNMYGYCRNNPIKRIDIGGFFDWENITAWNDYSTIAVFPAERDQALQMDYEAAQIAYLPIVTVSDVSDFEDALNSLTLNGNNFENISINSHGNFNGFNIGSEKISITSNLENLKDNLAGKTMFIGACNVGQNGILVQQIAEDTGALVIAPQHKIPVGFKYDGSDFLNHGPLLDPNSSQYTKSDGVNISTITNFTIDRKLGTFWDGKLFFE